MPRQRRPHGTNFPVDAVWKADIHALLEKRGISQAELARRIGASPGSITLIFKPETSGSKLVAAIHRVLDLDPPVATTAISERDDAKRKLDHIWRDLTPNDREQFLALGERFRRQR